MTRRRSAFLAFFVLLLFSLSTALPVHAAEAILQSDGNALPTSVFVGQTYTLICRDAPVAANKLRWTVSDTRYATIDQNGVFKVIKQTPAYSYIRESDGRVINTRENLTITVYRTDTNKKLTARDVKIYKRAVSVDPGVYEVRLLVDDSYTASPILTPADATDRVIFRSADTAITGIGLETGIVKPKAQGKTTINVYSCATAASSASSEGTISTSFSACTHTHKWSGSYVKLDSFMHYLPCGNAYCTLIRPQETAYYAEHDYVILSSGRAICRKCNYEKDYTDHDHEWSFDGDDLYHWEKCSGCKATRNYTYHNFDKNNVCMECGVTHIHNDWQTLRTISSDYHWFACKSCDAIKRYTKHTPENTDATCLEKYTCSVCRVVYGCGEHGELKWNADGNKHARFCTVCEKEIETQQEHKYEKITDILYRCSVCSHEHEHMFGEWQQLENGHIRKCENPEYTTLISERIGGAHTRDERDVCTFCGYMKKVPPQINGSYAIRNQNELWWFADKVNGGNPEAKAEVYTDIFDIGAVTIGSDAAPFTGVFDGGGYTLSGFSLTADADHMGLFGKVSGGTVKNFTLRGEVILDGDRQRVGGVAGSAHDGAVFENIASEVTITGSGVCHHIGGIVGSSNQVTDSLLTIRKCRFGGKIDLPNTGDCIGGILGYAYSGVSIYDCFFDGDVRGGASGHVGGILGYLNNKGFLGLSGCYAVPESASSGAMIIGTVRFCPPEKIVNNVVPAGRKAFGENTRNPCSAYEVESFADGKAAYLLNGGVTDGSGTWKQTLGSDAHPVWNGNSVVYRVGAEEYSNTARPCVFFEGNNVCTENIEEESLLILSLVTEKGMVQVKTVPAKVGRSQTDITSLGFSVPQTDGTLRAFLWKDLLSAKPVAPTASVPAKYEF